MNLAACLSMKEEHKLTRFKSLKVALKELEPFVKNGQHLRTGKPFKQFGDMRSREMLANWLLCATINAVEGGARDLAFWSDRKELVDEATDQPAAQSLVSHAARIIRPIDDNSGATC